MKKFRVSNPLELVRLAATLQSPYILHYQGKIFVLAKGSRRELFLFYAEENPKSPFIKYDLFKDEIEWVNVRKRATDVVYLPVIMVDKIEGMEL